MNAAHIAECSRAKNVCISHRLLVPPINIEPETSSNSPLESSSFSVAKQRAAEQLRHLFKRTVVVSKAVSIRLIESLPDSESTDYSSVMVEYSVPRQKGWSFRLWHRQLVRSAKASQGFVRADRYRPLKCKDGVLKWHCVLHFEKPEHLNQWLASTQREAALQTGKSIFEAYKFKSFSTGLEGWFSQRSGSEIDSLGPPVWKQILSVVLGLYPVISVQERVFGYFGILEDWPPAIALCANLIVTSCILSFVVMPIIVRLLHFWLQPAHQPASMRANVVGIASTLTALGGMMMLFNALP